MRKMLLLTLATIFTSLASAETVYLIDGSKIEGVVTRNGDKVHIATANGNKTVKADDVLYIAKSVTPDTSTPHKIPDKTPDKQPTTIVEPPSPKDPPDPVVHDSFFTVAKATRPEQVIFLLMRSVIPSKQNKPTFTQSQEILKWQQLAKDRSRRIRSNKWIVPEDILRMKKTYFQHIQEAKDFHRKIKYDASKRKNKNPNYAPVLTKLIQAGGVWPDVLLSDFLTGVAHLQAGDHRQADTLFARALDTAPRLAALHQGRGMALVGEDKYLDGLNSFITMLQLQPESRDALFFVQWAIEKVPGKHLNHPDYVKAKKLLDNYKSLGAAKR
ncbi:MAG TPA: hypothetical protein ENL03_06240, partial [Phycisphaerae bacterium]|nr:hypothetical protein [Phycisphaerae bacterium]